MNLSDAAVNAILLLLLSFILLISYREGAARTRHTALGWMAALSLAAGIIPDAALTRTDVLMAIVAVATTWLVARTWHDWSPAGQVSFAATLISSATFLLVVNEAVVSSARGGFTFALAVAFFALQIAAHVLMIVHTFEIIDVVCRRRWRKRGGLVLDSGFTPYVSLHVPIHREPPDLVIETLEALAALDYSDFEVLVIDNNTEDESLWRPVEAACRRLGPRFRFFHLLPWPGYKSGALNFALRATAPDASIIGVIDADYVVEPGFLSELVGHFANQKLAFLQTPQDYRDADARGRYGRALYLSYRYFFDISMASRNERNAIIYGGTMGLIRRSALERAGGWDEWCITEDAELSLRLLAAGDEGLFVDRTYGRGLMPLDYAGLKKQRFRWAFGGMQILRMHAGQLLNPFGPGRLTLAQRAAYIIGGLQWLNDPLTLAFTVVLALSATLLALGGELPIEALPVEVAAVPVVFLSMALLRFVWGFRARAGCSCREAADALTVLLGLTWVVTTACVRGLVSKEGRFLRTPKAGAAPTLWHTLRVITVENLLLAACLGAGGAILLSGPLDMTRLLLVILLAWQAAVYGAALRTSLWSYEPAVRNHSTGVPALGRMLALRQRAIWLGAGLALIATLLLVTLSGAPGVQRIIEALSVAPVAAAPARPGAAPDPAIRAIIQVLANEAASVSAADVDGALALWSADGMLVDEKGTADRLDDVSWEGGDGLRERYTEELRERRYRELRHTQPHVHVKGDRAVVVNGLRAVVDEAGWPREIELRESDRWTLARVNGRWLIHRLEVNRGVAEGSQP